MTREDETGAPPGGWQPQERIDRLAAIAGYTTGAAYAGFAEEKLGSLTPGHAADFLILDRDIFTATPAEIRGTKVLETWLAGTRAWVGKGDGPRQDPSSPSPRP